MRGESWNINKCHEIFLPSSSPQPFKFGFLSNKHPPMEPFKDPLGRRLRLEATPSPPKKNKSVCERVNWRMIACVSACGCVCVRETSVARTSHDCHAWTREREREVSTMGASKICSPLSLSLSLTLNSPTLFFSYEANFQVSGAWEVDEGRISVSPFRPKSPKIIVFCREQFLVIVVRCLNWFWAIFYYYVLAIISDDWSVKLKIGPRVNYIFGHFLLHSRRHWRILVTYEWRKHL